MTVLVLAVCKSLCLLANQPKVSLLSACIPKGEFAKMLVLNEWRDSFADERRQKHEKSNGNDDGVRGIVRLARVWRAHNGWRVGIGDKSRQGMLCSDKQDGVGAAEWLLEAVALCRRVHDGP